MNFSKAQYRFVTICVFILNLKQWKNYVHKIFQHARTNNPWGHFQLAPFTFFLLSIYLIIFIFYSNRFWVKSQSSFHKNSWWYLVVFYPNHNFVLHCKLGCLFDSWKNDHSNWKCRGFIETKRYCLWNFVWGINNDFLQRFKNWSLSKGM